jgi:hypothetical protein
VNERFFFVIYVERKDVCPRDGIMFGEKNVDNVRALSNGVQ